MQGERGGAGMLRISGQARDEDISVSQVCQLLAYFTENMRIGPGWTAIKCMYLYNEPCICAGRVARVAEYYAVDTV